MSKVLLKYFVYIFNTFEMRNVINYLMQCILNTFFEIILFWRNITF